MPSIAPKSPTVGDILPGKLGFGAAPLGNMLREIQEPEALATVDTAWNDGIRYFGNAPFYGAGLAEIRMARRSREMRPDLEPDFLRQNGELACQQRANTKRSAGVRDAGFPIPRVEAKLFARIGHLTFEARQPRFNLFPIPREQRSDQIDLAWEMVMDARLTNPDHISDVGITETVVAVSDDQGTRAGQDVISGGR